MTVPIYLTTSDRYLPALLPFAHQLNKYWQPPPPVIVGGFTPPDFELPPNWKFLTIGSQDQYPIKKWTNAVKKMIQSLNDRLFILMLEDYWITGPVDVEAIAAVEELCRIDDKLLRMDLTLDRAKSGEHNHRHYGNIGPLELIQSNPSSPYHLSLMTAIWRKNLFLSVLQDDWSPWDVEIIGTLQVQKNFPGLRVLGTTARLVPHTLAFRGGSTNRLILDELDPQDVDELRDLGLLQPWEKEPSLARPVDS